MPIRMHSAGAWALANRGRNFRASKASVRMPPPTNPKKLASVGIIPMNPIAASTLGPPDLTGVLAFQHVLLQAGYSCFIRRRRGDDVSAACGQLALLGAKPKVKGFRIPVESS